ncbi:riboflavin biosynthesis protein RibF [Lentisphaera araneosa HTCC2155]|jgi:riboflavin kinase / FMN adenylyltransferase|uniref:Riboflavin biosynthesis protein n=1 Tax=Lentisphaera araneosa HTCC2155 TaxID=313628 RepID=A6DGZ2_9BACT|nr:riboflavin biosynthesis protein RibF [Lentisphaera araneosa]EDM28875.1 riboflavin biosynthesis protein RibF [Lentisphaera araneosa HTCC2155]
MLLCHSLQELQNHGINDVSIACGNFDGIHRGHRKLLQKAIDQGKENNSTPVVLSFSPHPREFFTGQCIPTLSSLERRLKTFESLGIKALVILPFNKGLAETPPRDFIKNHLLESGINLTDFCVGREWLFGADRKGDINLLQEYSDHFTTHPVDEYLLDGEAVSSSRIRKALEEHKFAEAERLLSHKWYLSGKVVKGLGLASEKLKTPTANIDTGIPLLPISGVFAVHAKIDRQVYTGILNIGSAPTFLEKQQHNQHVELHIFDFSGELYDKEVSIHIHRFIRDEKKFDSPDELKKQIQHDIAQARQIL